MNTSHCRSLILTIAIFCLGIFSLSAQPKEFKQSWKRLMGPLYFQSETMLDKLPLGHTRVGLFGFEKDNLFDGDFTIEGRIFGVNGGKNEGSLEFTDATAHFRDNLDYDVTFKGDLHLFFFADKQTRRTGVEVQFGTGVLTVNGVEVFIKEEDQNYSYGTGWQQGQKFTTSLYPEYKDKPTYLFLTKEFNLPKKETVTTVSPDLVKRALAGDYGDIKFLDADLMRSILPNPEKVGKRTFPDYTEWRTTLYERNDPSKIIYQIIDSVRFGRVHMSPYDARMTGSLMHLQGLNGYASFDGDKIKSAMWQRRDTSATFDGSTFIRFDGSKLCGVSYDPEVFRRNMPTGYAVKHYTTLEHMADPSLYDFNELAKEIGLTVKTYVSPAGKEEEIVDNFIPSVKAWHDEQARIAAMERSFIGPDRPLADVRGHASEVNLWVADGSAYVTPLYERLAFDYDGRINGGSFCFSNKSVVIPLNRLNAAGTTFIPYKIGTKSVRGSVERDASGQVRKIVSDVDGSTQDYRYLEISWTDGRPAAENEGGIDWGQEVEMTYDQTTGMLVKEVLHGMMEGGAPYTITLNYDYPECDDHNNWTTRNVTCIPNYEGYDSAPQVRWTEKRTINYYPPVGSSLNDTQSEESSSSRPVIPPL